MLITDEYRQANADLHEARPDYGISGKRWADTVRNLIQPDWTVLDYGCGKSTLKANLSGVDVKQYDPAIPQHAAEPGPADMVVCTDVLEHIEPDCLDDVLAHIASLSRRLTFMTVATRPAVKTLSDGRNAHLIIEPPVWWFPRISRHMSIDVFNRLGDGEFLVMAGAQHE